jgi:hypothetical protein
VLQSSEEALDNVTVPVLGPIYWAGRFSVGQLRNHGRGPKRLNPSHYCFGVVSLIGSDRSYLALGLTVNLIKQSFRLRAVMYVASGENETSEVTKAFYCSVNLCCEATTRASNRLRTVFLGAPLACW